jgi:hypothetical protein
MMATLRKSYFRIRAISHGPYAPLLLIDDEYETQEPDQASAAGAEMWRSYLGRHIFWTVITEKLPRRSALRDGGGEE